jgi:hypothetical protein
MAPGETWQHPRPGQVFTRKLLVIPIIHSQTDLGALGEATAREAQKHLGQRGWQHKVRAVELFWRQIEQVLKGLKLPDAKLRLYQDGLPVCGREAALVAELARAGSRNHQILEDLVARGATLMGTESWELLQEEYRLARDSLAAAGPGRPGARVRMGAAAADLLAARDRFIAARIPAPPGRCMGYALKILGRFGAGGGSLRRLRFETLVPCAFCAGSGTDPKYGKPGSCPVCKGAGELETVPPVVTCRPCGGSGRGPGDLICLSCRGRGVAPVAPEAGICPRCRGTGADGIFYCNSCKGQGIV